MPCEQIGSFEATPLLNVTYQDSDGNPVTISSNTQLDKENEVHRKLIRHLYRRIGYGAGWADIENADNKTIDELVDTLIVSAANIPFPTEFDWTEEAVNLRDSSGTGLPPSSINGIISNYWINESIVSITNSIRAKLMLFWHDHFAADEVVHPDSDAVLRYFKVLFTNSFGNFKDFVKKIGRTPTILMYLSGHDNHGHPIRSKAGYSPAPNENYAREILELFTMGVEYDGDLNYTKDDIYNLARALSGWRIRRYAANNSGVTPPTESEFRFQYLRHDWGTKTILETTYFNRTAPTNTPSSDPNYLEEYDPTSTNPITDYDIVGWLKLFPCDTYFGCGENEVIACTNTVALAPPCSSLNNAPYAPIDITGAPYQKNAAGQYVEDDGSTLLTYDAADPVKTGRMIITAADDEYNYIHDEIIFKNRTNAIAYFICKKIYDFYVYQDADKLDEGAVTDYVESLATTFKDNNWDIIPVLKQLFKSQHFYDPGIMGTQIKSPVECAASFFRAGNLQPGQGNDGGEGQHYTYRLEILPPEDPDAIPPFVYTAITDNTDPNYYNGTFKRITGQGVAPSTVRAFYNGGFKGTTFQIKDICAKMGQHLLNPPDVSGWPGHRTWLNEFTLVKRWEMISEYFIDYLSTTLRNNMTSEYNVHGGTYGNVMNALNEFRNMAASPSASNPNGLPEVILPDPLPLELQTLPVQGIQMVWKMWRHMFAVEPASRQIKDALAAYMKDYAYPGFPSPNSDSPEVRRRIGNLLLYFIRQPEFQLT